MLSTFQVTTSVCVPDRWTVGLDASEKTRPVVEHAVAPALHVATVLNEALLSVPPLPVAAVHVAAFHETSLADQVVPPPAGGVNDDAVACSESRSCLVAVAKTIWSMVTLAATAAVAAPMFVTLKEIPAGTATRACSLTMTETVVVWLVSGRTTVVCASADALHSINIPANAVPIRTSRTSNLMTHAARATVYCPVHRADCL